MLILLNSNKPDIAKTERVSWHQRKRKMFHQHAAIKMSTQLYKRYQNGCFNPKFYGCVEPFESGKALIILLKILRWLKGFVKNDENLYF